MSANFGLLIIIGALVACGVYLILERRVTKMLLGMILFGNAVNLLIMAVGGANGTPPLVGHGSAATMTDPLAQAMILTAIVITMGVAAFVLALGYRSFTLTSRDDVQDDPEDAKVVAKRAHAEPAEEADKGEDEPVPDSEFDDEFDPNEPLDEVIEQ